MCAKYCITHTASNSESVVTELPIYKILLYSTILSIVITVECGVYCLTELVYIDSTAVLVINLDTD